VAACSVLIKVLFGNTHIKSNLLHPNHRARVTAALLPISSITQSNSHHILFCFCFGSELIALLRHMCSFAPRHSHFCTLIVLIRSCHDRSLFVLLGPFSPIHLVPQTFRPSRGLSCCRFTLPAMLFDSFVANHSSHVNLSLASKPLCSGHRNSSAQILLQLGPRKLLLSQTLDAAPNTLPIILFLSLGCPSTLNNINLTFGLADRSVSVKLACFSVSKPSLGLSRWQFLQTPLLLNVPLAPSRRH